MLTYVHSLNRIVPNPLVIPRFNRGIQHVLKELEQIIGMALMRPYGILIKFIVAVSVINLGGKIND